MLGILPGIIGLMQATELKGKLDRGEPVTLIDVREPHEWRIMPDRKSVV